MILMLSESKGAVSLEQLAERFEVSQRTVRNDINEISSLLKKKGLRELHMRKGVITVQEDFGGILPELDPTDYYSYKLSKEDSNKGLRVEGPESEKRWFLYRLSAFKIQSASSGQSTPVVNVQAGDAITIRKIVSEQEKVHRRYLSDQSYLMIVKYLGIMIDRNLKGEYIEERPAEASEYFSLAQDIIRYIVQYCGIRTIENEIRYLAVSRWESGLPEIMFFSRTYPTIWSLCLKQTLLIFRKIRRSVRLLKSILRSVNRSWRILRFCASMMTGS